MKTASNRGLDSHTMAILVIVVVAAVLRFYDLDRTGIWLDESFSWFQTSLPFKEMYLASANSPHPPLQNFLAWPWVQIFGDSETAMRSLPALLGTTNIFLLYLTARLIWNRESAVVAAAILTFSGFHIWYSQEFRDYALLSLTATIYMHSVFRMLCKPGSSVYVYNTIGGVLLLYSHVFGSFLFAGVNLYLGMAWLLKTGGINFAPRKWLAGQLVAMAIFAQWALILLGRRNAEGIRWIPELDLYWFFSQLAYLFNGPLAAVVMCCIALYSLYCTFLKPASDEVADSKSSFERRKDELILVWLTFPILAAMVLSFLVTPLFVSRYLILCLPAMCLLVSKGLLQLDQRKGLQTGVGLLLLLGLIYSVWDVHHRDRPQYRSVIQDMQSCYQPGDLLVVIPANSIGNFRYYWRDPEIEIRQPRELSEFQELLPEWDRIWVIIRYSTYFSSDFPADQVEGSHDVVWSRKAFQVNSYLLIRQPPLDAQSHSIDSICIPGSDNE